MRVSPQNGPAWVGQFEPDDPYFPSGAYACPSGDALLVVSEGNGYIVSVADPTNYETVKSPLLGVARVPARPLVFAWTEQDLLAFDESGEKWWIENLAVDGLRITEISSSTISGLVANVVTGERCSVTIDVETGSVAGGWPTDSEGGISARVHTRGGET